MPKIEQQQGWSLKGSSRVATETVDRAGIPAGPSSPLPALRLSLCPECSGHSIDWLKEYK